MANLQADKYEETQSIKDFYKDIILSGQWEPFSPMLKPYMKPAALPFGYMAHGVNTLQSTKILDEQILLTNQPAGTSLKIYNVRPDEIESHITYFTALTDYHQYMNMSFQVSIQVLGSPRCNGVIAVSFIPWGALAKDDVIFSQYGYIQYTNLAHTKFIPLCQNSTHDITIPLSPPFKYLNTKAWSHNSSSAKYDMFKNYMAGVLRFYCVTDVEIPDTSSIKPTITFYTSALAEAGAPRYDASKQEV